MRFHWYQFHPTSNLYSKLIRPRVFIDRARIMINETYLTSDLWISRFKVPVFDGKIRLVIDRISGGNIQIQNLEILSFILIYKTSVAQKYTRFRKIATYPIDYWRRYLILKIVLSSKYLILISLSIIKCKWKLVFAKIVFLSYCL